MNTNSIPKKHDTKAYQELCDQVDELIDDLDTGNEDVDELRRNVLKQLINFIQHTLKTNFYRNNKVGVSFRLDPRYLDNAPFDRPSIFPTLPLCYFLCKRDGLYGISYPI